MARKPNLPEEELMMSGHVACLGCGAPIAMRHMLKALGKNTIINLPACCWAVIPGVWPHRCLDVPLLYNAFETTAATTSGVVAALKVLGKEDEITAVGWAGDGGTADIGIQALSGAVERNTNFIYVMYDNEAYMNTGIQRSSATPVGAWTTTTPVGTTQDWKKTPKKNMVEIMVAHRIPYTATANIAYPEDLIKKFKKAKEIKGSRFIHIYAPCPTGWKCAPELTVELGKLAQETGVFPLYEVEHGKYKINRKPKELRPVKDYLKIQGRFRHLPEEEVENIQRSVEAEWRALLRKEEMSKEEE